MSHQFAQFVFWHREDFVHPDDLPRLKGVCTGLCYRCYSTVGAEGDFLVIDIAGEQFRVKCDAIRPLPPPHFVPGQLVRTTNGTPRQGWIADVGWHHDENKHTYRIDVDGTNVPRRRVSRRYWEEDLEVAD